MGDTWFIVKEIWHGKSITRALLNARLRSIVLSGQVMDIGGGKHADYLACMPRAVTCEYQTLDKKTSSQPIDFETDKLPLDTDAYDRVIFLNVLEHIFAYQHLASEVVRITKPGGVVVGFVPFLMWYHPDHHDYFRYTDEALKKIFAQTDVRTITVEPIGGGPFLASAQMSVSYIPRIIRPGWYLVASGFDTLYTRLKGSQTITHQLGYLFLITK